MEQSWLFDYTYSSLYLPYYIMDIRLAIKVKKNKKARVYRS